MKSEPSTDWNRWKLLPDALNSAPPLIHALNKYPHGRLRFHVPAHAGSALLPEAWDVLRSPYRYDVSELEGLDVLSEPAGCIQEAQAQIAQRLGVAHTFFLVNGASVGIAAAMLAGLKPGDSVLLPRNVHRSVLSGLILTGAKPIWCLPERLTNWGLWGAMSVDTVKSYLEQYPDIRMLVLTSPTYEGLGSDVQTLAELCRQKEVLLVVDEAHGGLWPYSEQLPVSACHLDCDAVIHSLHKTGGSLTQSALAHLPNDSRLPPEGFQQALNTLQTTSPSYLLMASLDATCHWLTSEAGQQRLQSVLHSVAELREVLDANLQSLRLFTPTDRQFWDPSKLYLRLSGISGETWGPWLEQHAQLSFEAVSPYGVLYLANIGLRPADFEVFSERLLQAERELNALEAQPILPEVDLADCLPEMAMLPREAFFAKGILLETAKAVGQVAKETVVHCPPGIPVLLPGEKIRASHLPYLPEDGVWVVTS